MRQEVTVQRTLPVNIAPKDHHLFEDSLSVTFERLLPIHLKHVWILQDTVFSPGELKFYTSYTHIANLGPLQFAKRAVLCSTKTWRRIPKGIWIIDEWSANYFHWMTDCMPRIWEGLERDTTSPIILPESFKSLSYVTQSLELLNVRVEFFKSWENLKVDTLIMTARTASFPNFNPALTQKTREKLAIIPKKSPWRKIYISRKLAQKRRAHNELEAELMLRKRGFEIIYSEQMTVKQQIELMAETKLLVCLHGAALTNILFLPKEAKVLELRNIGDSITQCYFNLASALQVDYFYTLNRGDHKDTIMTDFTIDLNVLESVLELIR